MARRAVRFALAVLLTGVALLGTRGLNAGAAPAASTVTTGANSIPPAWAPQPGGTREPLFAVSCFDALRCKAVGANGTILFTRNGGTTWRPQSNPLTGSSTILYRIACVGRSTCYVLGRPNIIMVTHNGGVRWSVHRLSLPGLGPELTDATCVSGQVYDLRGRPALCRLGLLDLACPSASTCLAVATLHVQRPIGVLGSVIFLTTDGGATWTSQKIPAAAPCGGDCGTITRVPYPLEWISCGPGSRCRAGGSTFVGSHEGYATLTIQTTQAGEPWTPLEPDTNPAAGYGPAPDAAVCPTTTRCYGVWTTSPFTPGNEIWRSNDGGWQWQPVKSGSPRLRNAIACPDARTCYSVGNQGSITASLNGGPFVAQRSGTSHDLYGVTCVGMQTCFAVGNKGTIVRALRPAR